MKNTKRLIILGIILMLVLGWYVQFNRKAIFIKTYQATVVQAEEYSKKDLCLQAIKSYNKLLILEETLDTRIKILNLYQRAYDNGELERETAIESYLDGIVNKYNRDPKAYEIALDYYLEKENYDICSTLLSTAKRKDISSEKIENILKEIRYKYNTSDFRYDQVFPLSSDLYLYMHDSKYGYQSNTKRDVASGYELLTPFSEGYAIGRKNNYTYLLDREQTRICYFSNDIESALGVGNGLIPCKINGQYSYYGLDGKKQFGDYMFAGKFVDGIAAVKESDGWRLIDINGKYLNNIKYEDIKLNQLGECVSNNVLFVKQNGIYGMVNMQLEPINHFTCDDVDLFVGNFAAYKKGDKWGYVTNTGEIYIEPKYENAKSPSGGFIAVEVNGKWGFMKSANEMAIDPQYEEVLYFNNGSCFVKDDKGWALISLYYYED